MKHYILFVGDADEVLSPEYLTRLNSDREGMYNFLNDDGRGFAFAQMDTRV